MIFWGNLSMECQAYLSISSSEMASALIAGDRECEKFSTQRVIPLTKGTMTSVCQS